MYLVKKPKPKPKKTAGINIAFGHMFEDVLFVTNVPLREMNLCICILLKWKIGENLESQGISSIT